LNNWDNSGRVKVEEEICPKISSSDPFAILVGMDYNCSQNGLQK